MRKNHLHCKKIRRFSLRFSARWSYLRAPDPNIQLPGDGEQLCQLRHLLHLRREVQADLPQSHVRAPRQGELFAARRNHPLSQQQLCVRSGRRRRRDSQQQQLAVSHAERAHTPRIADAAG